MEKLYDEGWRMPLTSYSPLNTGSHIMLSDAQIAQMINGTGNSKDLLLAAERNLRDLKEQLRNAERRLEESAVLQLAELESVCDSHDLSIRKKDGAQARLENKVSQLQARVIVADQLLVEAAGVEEGLKIENASLLERLDVAQREREHVQVDLQVAGRLLEEEQDARGCLEAKYDSIQEDLGVAERKNVDVQGRLDIVELEKKDLQGRLDSSSRENGALQERVQELESLLKVAAAEKDSVQERLEQQLDKQEEELARIRSHEDVREAAHDVAVGKVSEFQALVSTLNGEKSGIQESLDAANLRLAEKEGELQTSAEIAAGYIARIMALESSVTQLTAEKSEVHIDLITAREVCVALSAKVDDGDRVEKQLTDILSSVSEKAEYAAKEHESLKIKFDENLITSQCNEERLNRDIGTLTVARTELVTQGVSVRKELLVAHAKIEELQLEVGDKKKIFEDFLAAKDMCITLSIKVEEAVETARQRTLLLDTVWKLAENSAVQVQSMRDEFEESMSTSRSDVDRLSEEIGASRVRNTDLVTQIDAMRVELSSANAKIEELQLEVAVHTDRNNSLSGQRAYATDSEDDSGSSTRTSSAASSNDSG